MGDPKTSDPRDRLIGVVSAQKVHFLHPGLVSMVFGAGGLFSLPLFFLRGSPSENRMGMGQKWDPGPSQGLRKPRKADQKTRRKPPSKPSVLQGLVSEVCKEQTTKADIRTGVWLARSFNAKQKQLERRIRTEAWLGLPD